MAKDIISKPLLKTTYIDNQNCDKVLYLEIPSNIKNAVKYLSESFEIRNHKKETKIGFR